MIKKENEILSDRNEPRGAEKRMGVDSSRRWLNEMSDKEWDSYVEKRYTRNHWIMCAYFVLVFVVFIMLVLKYCANKSPKEDEDNKAEAVNDSTGGSNYDVVVTEEDNGNLVFEINGVSFRMVKVDGGTFFMGSNSETDDEMPVHKVKLSDYYIGETEVTQELWNLLFEKGSYFFDRSEFKGGSLPVESVGVDDCIGFFVVLNDATGLNFNFPTEAQWEYAAKGGAMSKSYMYSGSSDIDEVAWYVGNSGGMTHSVATKKPNELGLYDMSGNVCEWCCDVLKRYEEGYQKDPVVLSDKNYKVVRGGSWTHPEEKCSSTSRMGKYYNSDANYCGFRLALECPILTDGKETIQK